MTFFRLYNQIPPPTNTDKRKRRIIYQVSIYPRLIEIYITDNTRLYIYAHTHRENEIKLMRLFPSIQPAIIGYKRQGMTTEKAFCVALGINVDHGNVYEIMFKPIEEIISLSTSPVVSK